jgi:predicted Rossmann fold nucleotide-binding protein DprA/Smf involved in DNA uptake
MKVAIVGSRDYRDLDKVRRYVYGLPTGTEVVSGGARGVDRAAASAARKRGLLVTIFYADWSQGALAGLARNTEIVQYADRVVAFWDGKSSGTQDSVRKARKLNKPVTIYRPQDDIEAEEP